MSQGKLDDFDFDSQWESLLNDSSGQIQSTASKQPLHHLEKESVIALTEEGESTESETEEDEFDEIDLNPDDIKLDGFNEKLNTLLIQMEEIRKKYIKEVESRRKIELANKDLLFKVADLEEENVEYQGIVVTFWCNLSHLYFDDRGIESKNRKFENHTAEKSYHLAKKTSSKNPNRTTQK
jgi:hypothetical protein